MLSLNSVNCKFHYFPIYAFFFNQFEKLRYKIAKTFSVNLSGKIYTNLFKTDLPFILMVQVKITTIKYYFKK